MNLASAPAKDIHTRLENLYKKTGNAQQKNTVGETIKFIGFCLANEEFVIEIQKVKEITTLPLVTRVSSCAPFIEGIANLRGDILQILNFNTILELPPPTITEKSRIIVIDDPHVLAGIIVDSVSEVFEVEKNAMQNPPDIISGDKSKFIRGIIKQEKRKSILWLDCQAIYSEYLHMSHG